MYSSMYYKVMESIIKKNLKSKDFDSLNEQEKQLAMEFEKQFHKE